MSQNNKTQLHFQSGYYPSPLCSYKEYRGSAHRAKGLEYKQDPPIPPLSGGEVARKTEEKGRGLSERSEFRRPRRRLRRQTQKPDNRGGASWFVLLAAEKNEQITQISATETIFGGERKSSIQSPPAVPRSIAGCGARKYRGELRSVATRRGVKNTRSESNRGKPPLPLCRATIQGECPKDGGG